MSPAYTSLRECARRRIDAEWQLTERERVVLNLLEELSFGCGQMCACIPRQATLATACGIHPSDLCRVLKRLNDKGCISLRQHQRETLYAIELHCPAVPRRQAAGENAAKADALQELKALQERRMNGTADASGQLRFRSMHEAEDLSLEREALRAEMEVAAASAPPVSGPKQVSPTPSNRSEIDDEMEREIAAFHERMRTPAIAADPLPPPSPIVPPARSSEPDSPETSLEDLGGSLQGEHRHLWDRLCTEARRGSREGLRQFVAYAHLWRRRLVEDPQALSDAVGDHKLRKGGPANSPGGWIYSRYKKYCGSILHR